MKIFIADFLFKGCSAHRTLKGAKKVFQNYYKGSVDKVQFQYIPKYKAIVVTRVSRLAMPAPTLDCGRIYERRLRD